MLSLLAVLLCMQDNMLLAFPVGSYPTCAHQDLQVLFSRATSQSVSLQPLLLQEFLQLQEQDFAFVVLELPKALAGPFRQPV